MTSKFRSISPCGSVGLLALLLSLPLVNFASGQVSASQEGIPVSDTLMKAKCGSCHVSDDLGNMQRISWERATPEGWDRALQRMILLDDVDLNPSEK
ncbi:MAG TPA: hypothetical protein VER98_10740, partial [Terriglobia bacterium]|nr:hypothetical protein [Terriglobia bacterium]